MGTAPDGSYYTMNDRCGGPDADGVNRTMIDYYCGVVAQDAGGVGGGNMALSVEEGCPDGRYCKEMNVGGRVMLECAENSEEASCEESDGGNNFDVMGTAVVTKDDGSQVIYWDGCSADQKTMIEYYCEGKRVAQESRTGPEGQLCRVYGTVDGEDRHVGFMPSCFKYNDPNNDIYQSGIAYDSSRYLWFDFCDGDMINQYVCDENGLAKPVNPERCPNGCTAGACIR